jgi:hypothetical protein
MVNINISNYKLSKHIYNLSPVQGHYCQSTSVTLPKTREIIIDKTHVLLLQPVYWKLYLTSKLPIKNGGKI